MRTQYKATIALAVSVMGSALTMPVAGAGFFGGLCYHGFLAATIGGLADWFAVTALFHKPLGISYRTDILRRNRKRIMDELVAFSSDDLLSVENIMHVMDKQNTAKLMVDYMLIRGGRQRLKDTVDEVALKTVNSMDVSALSREISEIIRESMQNTPLEDTFLQALQQLSEEKYSAVLVQKLCTMLHKVYASPDMQALLLRYVSEFRSDYAGASFGREMALDAIGLSDERILEILNEKLLKGLEEIASGNSPLYGTCKMALGGLMLSLGEEVRSRDLLKSWKEALLSNVDIESRISSWMEMNIKGENPFWLDALHRFIDRKVDEFVEKDAWQRTFDRWVKKFIESFLWEKHDMIPRLIRERLDEFDDDEMVEFVEAKVADDLQMIRINGALVGSLVGMLLYSIVTLVERMWGL